MASNETLQCDVLIIGSGIAGATAALNLAENENLRIIMLTKYEDPLESNTFYAQGASSTPVRRIRPNSWPRT